MITNNYPYGKGEEFIETELDVIHSDFKEVIIISKNVVSKKKRIIPENIRSIRYNPKSTLREKISTILKIALAPSLFIHTIREEMNFIQPKISLRRLSIMTQDLIKAIRLSKFVEKVLKQEELNDNYILYSYWFDNSATAVSLIDPKPLVTRISRAHRGDLYMEESKYKYLSFQKMKLLKLDKVICISDHGKNYLESLYGKSDNCFVSRLGAP